MVVPVSTAEGGATITDVMSDDEDMSDGEGVSDGEAMSGTAKQGRIPTRAPASHKEKNSNRPVYKNTVDSSKTRTRRKDTQTMIQSKKKEKKLKAKRTIVQEKMPNAQQEMPTPLLQPSQELPLPPPLPPPPAQEQVLLQQGGPTVKQEVTSPQQEEETNATAAAVAPEQMTGVERKDSFNFDETIDEVAVESSDSAKMIGNSGQHHVTGDSSSFFDDLKADMQLACAESLNELNTLSFDEL